MKEYKWIAVALCLVLVLAGCTPAISWETPVADRSPGMDDQDGELPFTFVKSAEDGELRNGKLTVTINRSWVVTNQNEFPEAGGVRSDEWWPVVYSRYNDAGVLEQRWYPGDIVQEDGSFAQGVYFVLIEMTLTSEDAENWTWDDKMGNGGSKGSVPDPYMFSIPGGLQYPGSQSADTGWAYFSALYEVADVGAGYEFYLMPGETRTIIAGFMVDANPETGEPYDISELKYRISLDGGHTQVYLPLGESGLPE